VAAGLSQVSRARLARDLAGGGGFNMLGDALRDRLTL